MINNLQEQIKKFDPLFDSAIEFNYHIQLCKRGSIKGSTLEEIEEFQQKYNIKFPAITLSYLLHFGTQVPAKDTDYNCSYTLNHFEAAMMKSNLREEWNNYKTVKDLLKENNFRVNYDINYLDEEEKNPYLKDIVNIDDLLVYGYDDFSRTYKFIDIREENPYVYYFTNYDEVTSMFIPFSDRYRDILFTYAMHTISNNFTELKVI